MFKQGSSISKVRVTFVSCARDNAHARVAVRGKSRGLLGAVRRTSWLGGEPRMAQHAQSRGMYGVMSGHMADA
eukprot:8672592-Lingulodinium_polyedra.AAC.1